jgi:transketolase
MTSEELDQLAINTIRTLSIDAVQQAKSGHPGTPMALAPLVYALWNRVMRFDPKDPIWPNRDRFILSNGHASMLLWSVLYLTGTRAVNAAYERLGEPSVTLADIRRFRQLDSKAPGHPEYHWVSGVETTTGPLGQGIATSVGMAMARKWLAIRYNRPGFDLFDYNIYAVCGDGCLMEGVGSEAASLAGHLRLDDLCWIYDNNHITIEGKTRITFSEDVPTRFRSYGWNVLGIGDANNLYQIEAALATFRETKGRPTLIVLDSHIGYGSPHKIDTAAAHGEPLGEEEVRLVKRAYGWPEDAKFLVPDGVREQFDAGIGRRGEEARERWERRFAAYTVSFPELATEIQQMQQRLLPASWDRNLPSFPPDPKGIAGRDASGKVLNTLAQNVPWLLGARRTLRRPTRRCSHSKVPATSKPRHPAVATSTSAFESTRWRRSSTACLCRSCAPSARASSFSATTLGQPFGSRRSWSFRLSSSLLMMPWVTRGWAHPSACRASRLPACHPRSHRA